MIMKKSYLVIMTTVLFVLVTTSVVLLSCNNNNKVEKITKSNIEELKSVITGTIGYMDEESNFIEITQPQLEDFFREVFTIDQSISFNSYTIHSVEEPGGTDDVYVRLQSSSGPTSINVASELEDIGEGNFLMNGETTCKCESSGCSEGAECIVDQLGGGACRCVACSGGTCTKTTTATSLSFIQSFFATYNE